MFSRFKMVCFILVISSFLWYHHWYINIKQEKVSKEADEMPSDRITLGACPHIRKENLSQAIFPELEVFQKKLKEYTDFHQQQLRLIQDGTIPSSELRTLVWSCPDGTYCAGLGDQLFRIETAFLLALVSGRVFGIHWNDITLKTMRYLEPNVIRWDQVSNIVGDTPSFWHKVKYKKRTKKGGMLLAKHIYSTNHTDNHITLTEEIVVSMEQAIGFLCEGDSRSLGLFNKIGLLQDTATLKFTSLINVIKSVLLHYLFSFPKQLVVKVEQLEKQNGLTKPYLGIHLRTGFIGNKFEERVPKFRRKLVSDEMLWKSSLECSVSLADSMLGEESLLYLATDSYLVKKAADRMYPGRIVTFDIELEHVGMLNIEDNPTLRKKYQMQHLNVSLTSTDELKDMDGKIGMWVDFLMLARSHALVRATSGFSACASDYCQLPDSRLFFTPNCTHEL